MLRYLEGSAGEGRVKRQVSGYCGGGDGGRCSQSADDMVLKCIRPEEQSS
jgi:hypothetical protein